MRFQAFLLHLDILHIASMMDNWKALVLYLVRVQEFCSKVNVSMNRKKLICVAFRSPITPGKGDSTVLKGLLPEVAKFFDVYLICFADRAAVPELNNWCDPRNITLKVYPHRANLINVCFCTLKNIIMRRPVFHCLSGELKSHGEKNKKYNWEGGEIVLFFTYRAYFSFRLLFNKYNDNFFLFSIDDFIENYKSISRISKNPIVKYVYDYERVCYSKFLRERNRLFKRIFFVSPIDCERTKIYLGRDDLETIPLGMSFPNNPAQDFLAPQKNFFSIAFFGNMQYRPNRDAAKFVNSILSQSFLKKMLDKGFKINLMFGGIGSDHPNFMSQFTSLDHITFSGFYESVSDFLKDVDLVIAPVNEGTGVQNKVLEAISCGVRVIVSEKIAGSLGLKVPCALVGLNLTDYRNKIERNLSSADPSSHEQSFYESLLNSMSWSNSAEKLRRSLVREEG